MKLLNIFGKKRRAELECLRDAYITSEMSCVSEKQLDLEKAVSVKKELNGSVVLSAKKNVKTYLSKSKSITVSKNNSFASQLTQENTTYYISDEFDLVNNTIVLPKGCTLHFNIGGCLFNGTLVGNGCNIVANCKVFHNVNIEGTWLCVGNAAWFSDCCNVIFSNGAYQIKDRKDCSTDLQFALDSSFREITFPPVPYYISNTLFLRKEKKLVLKGSNMELSLGECQENICNTCIIFSDKNISLLTIAVKEGADFNQNSVTIEGGNFDVSLCKNYTSNCIEVRTDNGEKLWELNINTNIKGNNNNVGGIGININPLENKAMVNNKAYVTHVRINSMICNFSIGVKATNYINESQTVYHNWCTDIVIDGSIKNCPLAVESNVEFTDIRATLQAVDYACDVPLVRYTGTTASISSPVFDLQLSKQYAVEVSFPNAVVAAYGQFLSFYILCKNLGKQIVNGKIYGL